MTTDGSDDSVAELGLAGRRLRQRFGEVFSAETLDRFLQYSYDELASQARVTQWLAILAERFATQRLTALAIVEGKRLEGRAIVLILCVHNAGRSQMATGFLQHLGDGKVVGWSGGSEPASHVNPAAVAAMAECGSDIGMEYPKPWTDEIVRAADVVITMGCGDKCPVYPGKRYEDWPIADPDGLDLDQVRPIRDDIERRVSQLLTAIASAAGSRGGPVDSRVPVAARSLNGD